MEFDWKISAAGNSGIKYRIQDRLMLDASKPGQKFEDLVNASMKTRRKDRPAKGQEYVIGFEYQVLDDSLNEDNKVASHRAGALYDMIPPNDKKTLRPVGEWNASRLVFRGNHGEHWLNGAKVVEFDLGTPRMDSLLAKSKYRSIAGFADRRTGHIILQDHGEEAYTAGDGAILLPKQYNNTNVIGVVTNAL
jgi:hypothetical protein